MRHVLRGAAVLGVLAGGYQFWQSPASIPWRARLTGYDGCMCSDCIGNHLGISSPITDWVPLPGNRGFERRDVGLRLIAWGGAMAALSIAVNGLPLPRPSPRAQCAGCDYDLTGLAPDTPCPECGQKAVA